MIRAWTVAALYVSASLVGAACSSGGNEVEFTPMQEGSAKEPNLQPGDAIALEVWRDSDLSHEYRIDERGIVTFPLIGEMEVTGYSPDSLRTVLVSRYSEYLRDPTITVTMLRRISVLGEVKVPGLYPIDQTMTVLDAIALAGGITKDANRDQIRLVRDGRVYSQPLSETVLVGSLPIRSGDQIVVGQKSWINRNIGIVAALITATAVILAASIN
jgi:protein involved in polysaccharide export with SLBB domain